RWQVAQAVGEQVVALGRRHRRGGQSQIGAIKTGPHGAASLNRKLAADVFEPLRRGGGGERQHAVCLVIFGETGQLQIVGAEAVPPFRYAVCLVDREQGDLRATHRLAEPLVVESLGGDIQQVQPAVANTLHTIPHFFGREG